MGESFRQRFLREAGEHPYAWAASHGLPKDLVTAVVRGKDDYQPIRRTLKKLAEATGRSAEWWISGEDSTPARPSPGGRPKCVAQAEAPYHVSNVVGTVAGGSALVDARKLQLVIKAVTEWEDENNLDIDPERRSAVIAFLYDYMQKSGDDGEQALNEALRAIR